LGNCGTHITILNPRFVNIMSFVDRWLSSSLKMFKAYPYRECDNAAFTLLTEHRRIKWVERDLPNCTFDYVNMGILMVRFPKLVALAQELYATDKIFQETVDLSPHRGGVVKGMLEANVGRANPSPNIIVPYQRRELFRLDSLPRKKYFYLNDPFSRIVNQIRPKVTSMLQPKIRKIMSEFRSMQFKNRQDQNLDMISNPKSFRSTNGNENRYNEKRPSLYKSQVKTSHRLQAIYNKLRENNMKKIIRFSQKSITASGSFYPQRKTEFGRLY